MPEMLADTSLPSLARAVEISRSEMLRNYGRSPIAELYEGLDLVRVNTGVPHPFFNGVLRARLAPEQVEAAVDAATIYFRKRRTIWGWVIGPETQPPDLPQRLQARGLEGGHAGLGMGIDLQAVQEGAAAPAGLGIVRVGDAETQAAFVSMYVTGFGMDAAVRAPMTALECSLGWRPDLHYRRFLGLLEGRPVATTALLLGEQVAGVYHVSTAPWARRQGIGRAMTCRALLEAREAGYRIAVLHASEAGARIYRALGFRECTILQEYVRRSDG
jgi:ribosomal protein S18 acetylase RimI-like enzyme